MWIKFLLPLLLLLTSTKWRMCVLLPPPVFFTLVYHVIMVTHVVSASPTSWRLTLFSNRLSLLAESSLCDDSSPWTQHKALLILCKQECWVQQNTDMKTGSWHKTGLRYRLQLWTHNSDSKAAQEQYLLKHCTYNMIGTFCISLYLVISNLKISNKTKD